MIDTDYELSPELAAYLSGTQDRRRFTPQSQTWESVLRTVAPGLEIRTNVIDPSGGSLYSGGSSYSPEMPLLPSSSGLAGFSGPLCQRDVLSSLNNFSANLSGIDDAINKNVIVDAVTSIVAAAQQAGSQGSMDLAKRLAAKAAEWSSIAKQRGQVYSDATAAYQRIRSQVDALDNKALTLTASKSKTAVQAKKEAVAKAKVAVTYQKVAALASSLIDYAISQGMLLQQLASAVNAGNVGHISTLWKTYSELANMTAKARGLRQKQLATLKGGLQGIRRPVFVDFFEEDLNGILAAPKNQTVFNNYTVEPVSGFGSKRAKMKPLVGPVLKQAAAKVSQAAKQAMPRIGLPKLSVNPARRFRMVSTRRPGVNLGQIARLGEQSATVALINNGIQGVTPQQLTAVAKQVQTLVAGAAGSASTAIAQARKVLSR